eukprot:2727830-Amphidinium_carterae.1
MAGDRVALPHIVQTCSVVISAKTKQQNIDGYARETLGFAMSCAVSEAENRCKDEKMTPGVAGDKV